MNTCHAAKRGIAAAIIAVLGFTANAVDADAFGNDGIDRSDPNFVTASLLIVSPSDEIYSCVGHSGVRLECPTYNLDYCFTYESESAKGQVLQFIRGKLKMGLFAMPTAEYLKNYEIDGRGVVQYTLNLPPAAKQRLWMLFDGMVAKGANLPYDCLSRGCAQSIYNAIKDSLKPDDLSLEEWPTGYLRTRREIVDQNAVDFPWNRFFLCAVIGIQADSDVPVEEKVIVPLDLLMLLKAAKVNGVPVIDGPGVELLPRKISQRAPIITPMLVSCIVALVALINVIVARPVLDWLLLLFQSIVGALFTYMMFISDLPGTGWNWLIVPFNILPLVFWKWRQKWAMAFIGLLVLWEIGMTVYPHRLTDPAYLVLVGAYILFYLKFTNLTKMFRKG